MYRFIFVQAASWSTRVKPVSYSNRIFVLHKNTFLISYSSFIGTFDFNKNIKPNCMNGARHIMEGLGIAVEARI